MMSSSEWSVCAEALERVINNVGEIEETIGPAPYLALHALMQEAFLQARRARAHEAAPYDLR